ncbi:MAG: hydroxymethylbilane synthase [Bacteroidota bacterium]
MKSKIIIGTRGSKLALWQAHFTKDKLEKLGVDVELKVIKTKGDKIQHLSFDKIEGKGFFTKEIEDALLKGEIDMAVHSMKDLPTESPEGLVIAGVSYRENPADWLVINKAQADATKIYQLKEKAVVGTSSARRKAILLDIRPDIILKDIRGNVPTRLKKLREGQFDAIVLAAAGLTRLDLDMSAFEVIKLNTKEFVPAPAQGVLAYQACKDDIATRKIIKKLHRSEVATVTNVERKVLNLLEGGCHMPLGVYCEKDQNGNYHVWAAKADTWDGPLKRVRLSSSTHFELAEQVLAALKSE